MSNPKVFLVGGAVRDLMLGLSPKDFDFVVVGSTPEEMLSLGFEQVGADFPVFLHPKTGDEFALARTERKVGTGHKGFDCEWKGVTLEEDLKRRDLTINAMAFDVDPQSLFPNILKALLELSIPWDEDAFKCCVEDSNQFLIDPFNGQQHLKDKKLQHVSEHFSEDPLRVLRVCRLLARFGKEWNIDGSTMALMDNLVSTGALDDLTPERVWKEVSRALMENTPSLFFEALAFLDWDGFPELSNLQGCNQPPKHHPEVCTFKHIMLCIDKAAELGLSLSERFAVLLHDVGKPDALKANGGRHMGNHERLGVPLVKSVCNRWKVPKECESLAVNVCKFHTHVHRFEELRPITMHRMFMSLDSLRKPNIIHSLAVCSLVDARGRTTFENVDHHNAELMVSFHKSWSGKLDIPKAVLLKGGESVKAWVSSERVSRLKVLKFSHQERTFLHSHP